MPKQLTCYLEPPWVLLPETYWQTGGGVPPMPCIVGRQCAVQHRALWIGRGDKWENFDLIFFPTSETLKGLLTTN